MCVYLWICLVVLFLHYLCLFSPPPSIRLSYFLQHPLSLGLVKLGELRGYCSFGNEFSVSGEGWLLLITGTDLSRPSSY